MSAFWKRKKVFVTGHSGFKGAWLCRVLLLADADVTGFSLPELPTDPALFSLAGLNNNIRSIKGDVRDGEALARAVSDASPDVVIHMAAQPLVREGYADPVGTCGVNILGTVNILESVRRLGRPVSVLNVTTDKVYRDREWEWGYRETDRLGGKDPYSASKACSELITDCYRDSFFSSGTDSGVAVSTARAGNVIGGGDFARDRIIPDCARAVLRGEAARIRNPGAVRPYQHVLEPLSAYLTIAERQAAVPSLSGAYNIGPDADDALSTGRLVELFGRYWGDGFAWECAPEPDAPKESMALRLDSSRIRQVLGWTPRWRAETAVRETVGWIKAYASGEDIVAVMDRQIGSYFPDVSSNAGGVS